MQRKKERKGTKNRAQFRTVLASCLAVFCLAMAVRVPVLMTIAKSPFFNHPIIDAEYHDAWAQCLASDKISDGQKEFLRQPYFKPPLYPYLLSSWYRLFGRTLWHVKVAQAVLGALGCLLIFLITRKIFGIAPAWIAAVLGAVYWPWIFFDAWLLNTELVVFLDLTTAWLLLRYVENRSKWCLAAAGLTTGLSAITWPTGLLVGVSLVLWMGCIALKRLPGQRRIALVAQFLILAAVPVLFVAARNYIVGQDRVLISYNGGINLYTGSRPEADGISAVPTGIEWERFLRETDQAGIVQPSAVSQYWTCKTWEHIKESPSRYTALTLKRAVLFFNKAEPRNNIAQAYFLEQVPWLRALAGFGLVGSLWFLGLGLWLITLSKSKRKATPLVIGGWLCLAFVGARWAGVLPFFVCDRFRIAAVPFMLPFAGYAVTGFWWLLREKRNRVLALAIAILAGAGVFVNVDWFQIEKRDFSREHFFLGKIFLEQGDIERGERQLLAAIDEGENADAWVMLSYLRLQRGDFSGAENAARECLGLAPDTPSALNNLSSALLALDQAEAALPFAEEAVRLDPRRALYHLTRANILIKLKRVQDARHDLEMVRELPITSAEYELYRRLAGLVDVK